MSIQSRLKRFGRFTSNTAAIVALCALLLLVVFWNRMVHVVPAGHMAVVYHLFAGGTRTDWGGRSEGLQLILPWNKITIYDLRLQSRRSTYNVVTSDGLQVTVGITVRWRVIPQTLGYLQKNVGPDYVETLLLPAITSIARRVMVGYTAEELVSPTRGRMAEEIYKQAVSKDNINGITSMNSPESTDNVIWLADILIDAVELPQRIKDAIEQKLSQAQAVEEQRYRVEREKLETDRKRIEALGIRTFQEIVTPAISESYLKWSGIQATLKLAESPNSKVIVIGNAPGGLPLIFNSSDEKPAPQPRDRQLGDQAPTKYSPTALQSQPTEAPTMKNVLQ